MTSFERFPNAPIREAIIDIKVELPQEIILDDLEKFGNDIKSRYPEKKKRLSWIGEVEFKADHPPQIKKPAGGQDGFLFSSEKEQKIVQARLDGFTFNKLKPYDHWETFRDEGKNLWEYYKRLAKPKKVTRLALRYINSIEIPLVEPKITLKEHILTYPEFPDESPYKLTNFLVRLEVSDPNSEARANISQSIEPVSTETNVLPIIFDIDCYRLVDIDPESNEVWEVFEELRNFKNGIFFGSITKKTTELFR
ncbi:MAG: hypothetical protein NPINA01_01310 [Nitrospinaceae bacterium]|nr:MAG: hypothetical protein NPINA01_01310 [Nitrospinaceae bacterium]